MSKKRLSHEEAVFSPYINGEIYITINNQTHSLTEWSKISGINKGTIWARLKRGWNDEEAVFKPVKKFIQNGTQ